MGYSLLWQTAFWMVNKKLTKTVWHEASLILSILVDKEKFYTDTNKLTDDWFFYCTCQQIEEETLYKKKVQIKAIKLLEEHDFIKTDIRWMPSKKFYKINKEIINSFLQNDEKTMCAKNTHQCVSFGNTNVCHLGTQYNNRIIITDNPPTISNDIVGSPTLTSFVSPHKKEKENEVDNSDSFLYGNSNDQESSNENFSLYGKFNNSDLLQETNNKNLITSSEQQGSSLSGNEGTPRTLKNKPKKEKATLEQALDVNPGYQKLVSIFHRYISTKYFQGDATAEKYGQYAQLFIKKLCEANNIPDNQIHSVKDFFFIEAEKLVSNYITKEQVLKSFDRALIGWANRSVQFWSFNKFKQSMPKQEINPFTPQMSESDMMRIINSMKN